MHDQQNLSSAHWTRSRIIGAWALVQAILISVLVFWPFAKGDPLYYFRNSVHEPTKPLHGAVPLTEYPDAGLWPVRAIVWLCGDHTHTFLVVFSGFLILLSTAFFFYLLNQSHRAALFWTAFCAATGPIAYSRLDLIPGLLVAIAAAALFNHPKVASALLGFAAMSKLWPAALAAGLVDKWNRSTTWVRLATFAGTMVVVGLVTVLTSGWDRLVSPLTYQDVRGLQIESVLATPLILAAAFAPGQWHIAKAPSKSFEIFGPGVDQMLTLSSILMLATMLFGLGWALWRFIYDGWSPRSTSAFLLTMVLLLIVSNKVFSPQYVVWFGPVLAVMIAKLPAAAPSEQGTPAPLSRSMVFGKHEVLGYLPGLSVLAAALTMVVFPFTYNLLFEGPHWFAALVLTARNILMVVITFLTLRLAIREGFKDLPTTETVGVLKNHPLTNSPKNGAERFDRVKATFRRSQTPTQ